MTKVTSTRVFEKGQVAGTNSGKELNPFLDWVINTFENLVRILQKGVGIQDNMDADLKTVTLKNATPLTISVSKRPIRIHVGRQVPIDNPMTSFVWGFETDTSITLIAEFKNAPTSSVDVYLTIHYS